MNKDLKWVVLALLIVAATFAAFFAVKGPIKTRPAEVVVVKDPCRVCGQALYREELDYFITMWVGDLPVLIPVYKDVLHTCKGSK